MNSSDITVYIVDDDPAVRDSLTLMLQQDGYRIRSYGSGPEFLQAIGSEPHGCAIIDIRMPEMDGMQLQEEIFRRRIPLPVIFLTAHGDIPKSVKAMKAGAVDFLTKPVTRRDLLSALQSACNEIVRLETSLASRRHAEEVLGTLTERELQVTRLAILGHSNKEIARKLGISHRTIEIHKSNIMKKTGALNLLDLARIAHDAGLET
jgi:FixJ family two-component response regulator